MKEEEKKLAHEKQNGIVQELISFANNAPVPPLFNSIEIDGVIVKQFPFIRGNSALYQRDEPIPELDIQTTDFTLLSSRKNELENQIELHRKYCIGQYNDIKLATKLWLNDKVNRIGWTNDLLDDSERDRVNIFMSQIWTMQSWIMLGVEMDIIRKDLKKSYSPTVEVEPIIFSNKPNPISFNIDELIEEIQAPVESIERIVSRTVPLYFEYVNIQSKLYEFDIKKLFKEIDQDAVYLEIINAGEGIRAGKIALVQYVKEQFNCRTEEIAFNQADEIYRRIRKSPLYKDFDSYEPSKSSANLEDVHKILNRVK